MSNHTPRTVLLLNIFPGLGAGYFYINAGERFVLPMLGALAAFLVLGFAGLLSNFYIFAPYLAALVFLYLWLVISSYAFAKKPQKPVRQWYNRWYIYVVWLALAVGVQRGEIKIRETVLGYGTYSIGSDIMAPVIQAGEKILVHTRNLVQVL